MAQVETIRLVDDITGGEADETVDFGLDGQRFEIDLTAANAGRLRDGLAPFLAAARPADTPGARRARARGAASASAADGRRPGTGAAEREHNRAVRVWARENGYPVSERGRIPSEVVEAYRAGVPAPETVDTTEPTPDTDAPAVHPQAPPVRFSG